MHIPGFADSLYKGPGHIALKHIRQGIQLAAVCVAIMPGTADKGLCPVALRTMAQLGQQLSGRHVQVLSEYEETAKIYGH